MNNQYVQKVQAWVVLDNKALEVKNRIKDIQDTHKELFNQKDELEKEIVEYVNSNKLDAITIRTTDGNIKFSKKNSAQPLTLKLVKSLMVDFCKSQSPETTAMCENLFVYMSENLEKKQKISMVRKIE